MTRKARIIGELSALFAELSGLSLDGMASTTTFTELGFESLFLTQASLAIEKKFGVRVAFRQLLKEFSSVDAVAGHLDSSLPPEQQDPARPHRGPQDTPLVGTTLQRGNGEPREGQSALATDDQPEEAGAAAGRISSRTGTRRGPDACEIAEDHLVTVPVTESQRELWVASHMSNAASCAYSECRLLHLRGPLKAGALRAALQQLVNRHEALRTTFDSDGEFQHIHPASKLDVPDVDLTDVGAEERAARFDAMQIAESRRVFDLSNGPLARAQLIRLGEREHVLMLTIHHIVCDGHSFGILLRELAAIYSAAGRGVPNGLPAPLQLSEFVNAQTRRRANNGRPDDEAYWVKRFADGAPMLELPAERPRSAIRTLDGARASRLLPATLGRDLKRVAAQHGCTWFTTLLAGCFGLLRRLSGQREIVIGIPIADRAMERGDTLVGHCINFLPLRVTVIDDHSCAEHLGAVKEAFLDAHEHQHFTFGSLVQKLNLPRDGDRIPLVSVTFNAARLDGDLTFDGLETEVATNGHSFTNFDLSFDVSEMNGAVQLDCRYSKDVFAAETVQRWLGHFQTLLEAIAADPRQRVFELPLLTDVERERILVEWNDTRTDYPDKTVAQLFEEQVARTPESIAVEFEGVQLTYRELNERANQLAHHLRSLDVKPGVLIGLCLERSWRLIVGILGVLKAGGAYVPMDPSYPKDRLAYILEDAHAPVLLTQQSVTGLRAREGTQIVCLDADWPRIRANSGENPAVAAHGSDLAYVIYTSGSTGQPKGVALEHRNAAALVYWAKDIFTPEELKGVLASTSICFDLSIFEMFVPLSWGGTVILAENALALPGLAAAQEVTLVNTVPSSIHELLRVNGVPASVRVINLAGEPLVTPLVDRIYAETGVKRVYDLYGPTETTTYSTFTLRQAGEPPTIGRPLANEQVYLLDARQQPVPIGVPGELFIGGAGVARGYINKPELTAEKFLPNPFAAEAPRNPSAMPPRLYRTGDLARWRADGNIEFLGRIDDQVKIRGFRIELGEVEAALRKHPGLRDAIVIAREDGFGDKRLVAYAVCRTGRELKWDDLRTFMREQLPQYMVPSAFVFLEALPLTPNGKVDRKALPEPDADRREPPVTFNDDFEKQLAEIWQDLLGRRRVGANDDFFELGGHSLLALRLIARIETTFGKRMPVATVFDTRTVAQMAILLREESLPPRATSIVEIQPHGSRPPLMLVHGAGGGMLWGYTALAQQLGTDQPVYAFKSRGLDGQEEFGTIEEMAAHYIADLRTFQPQGPYYLGGYCFGGNVAYEMARQLHEQGERVALLALLNSIPPRSAYDRAAPTPIWLARFAGNLCYFTGCLLRRPRPERRLFIGWYARTFTRKIARLFARRAPSEVIVDELVDLTAYPPEQRQLWRAHIQALFQHRTKLHAGRVTLLRSRGHPFWCSFDYAYGWRAFAAGGAAVHLVPGAHEQILDEPHVSVLAEELRGELARAQNDDPAATNARPNPGASQPDAAKVPTAAVLPSPTIEPPAELVREPARPLQTASSIVEIQSHGSQTPLFLVHGIGGGMLWGYANLARLLGPDQPVYAFHSRGLDGREEFNTLEEMAAQYVADLRAFQPEGGYRLGGYCFGGNVAYEMARLLEVQGQQVSLLAMFNCPPPNSDYYRVRLTPGFCVNFLKNFSNRAGHVLRLRPDQRRQLVLWRVRVLKKHCLNFFNRSRGVTAELDVDDWVDLTTQPEDRRELWATHLRAYAGYQPKPYGGQVTLFRTRGHPLVCSFDDACGWREFVAGGVTVHIVPGEHESTLDMPHVKSVAKILEAYLQPSEETHETKPGRPVAPTPALNRVEKHPVPAEWNRTQADYPREQCVHHLFEEQVERTPQAVAVVFNNEQMTYAELNRHADEVAERLRALGIGPDVPVGICLERSLEMVIGVLAALKAGGAYLPLDPAYPTERRNLMIENSRSPLVLTQRELEKHFKSGNSKFKLICIEELLERTHPNESRTRTKDEDDSTPHSAFRKSKSSDLAYVIHTSGSTGTPKGVAMPHRPLVNLIAWQVGNSKLSPGARTLQFASLSFDVSFQEMFSTWCAGGTLVLVNENLRRDPVALWRFIRESKIARLFMPFVALQQLAEAFKPEASGDWALREIITAGEQLQTTPALVGMFERLTGCTLHNQYGPSESHVVTAFTLSGPPGQWPALPSIGRPIANTQILLLDEQRQRVPVGVPGELYIGGDCLARGYLHQPELTAGRFITNPFSDDAEARLYKTGDLACYQPDGNIEFLGRTDQQVKIRGFRIELGEIEATLRQQPKVRDAVVMARADQPGQKRLVAYYISQPEPPCTGEELRLFLKEQLPEYMVPTAFVSLEAFPLTPSGKVARNRLPAPDHSRDDLPDNFALPGTPTQQALAKIWCDVLGLPQIGIHDDFFDLGGNSILAVQAIARMSESFGVELPVSGLFESPTIAQAAEGLPAPPWEKERQETDQQPAMAN